MQKFKVTGMSCAACSARVEKAVCGIDGVTEYNVNLLTGDMSVEGKVEANTIIDAVIKAGYGIEHFTRHTYVFFNVPRYVGCSTSKLYSR